MGCLFVIVSWGNAFCLLRPAGQEGVFGSEIHEFLPVALGHDNAAGVRRQVAESDPRGAKHH